jgi:preprotein translocase subunit SecY
VRITLVGAYFLAIIAVIPEVASKSMGVDQLVARFLGGTGILIVVGVTLDVVDKLNASLLMRNYEGFMGSGKATARSR